MKKEVKKLLKNKFGFKKDSIITQEFGGLKK